MAMLTTCATTVLVYAIVVACQIIAIVSLWSTSFFSCPSVYSYQLERPFQNESLDHISTPQGLLTSLQAQAEVFIVIYKTPHALAPSPSQFFLQLPYSLPVHSPEVPGALASLLFLSHTSQAQDFDSDCCLYPGCMSHRLLQGQHPDIFQSLVKCSSLSIHLDS